MGLNHSDQLAQYDAEAATELVAALLAWTLPLCNMFFLKTVNPTAKDWRGVAKLATVVRC